MKEFYTDILDLLGLLLLAAGAGAAAYRYMGWSCLAVSGVIVLAGSFLASRQVRADKREPVS